LEEGEEEVEAAALQAAAGHSKGREAVAAAAEMAAVAP